MLKLFIASSHTHMGDKIITQTLKAKIKFRLFYKKMVVYIKCANGFYLLSFVCLSVFNTLITLSELDILSPMLLPIEMFWIFY